MSMYKKITQFHVNKSSMDGKKISCINDSIIHNINMPFFLYIKPIFKLLQCIRKNSILFNS